MTDLNQFRAVLLDMDGVLYRGNTLLPGVNELLGFLDARGVAYACVTNNSTLTPQQYEQKLAAMGIAMRAEQVITSSVATRRYLEQQAPRGTRVGYIGMAGLHEALFGDGHYALDQQAPEYVVVGGDFELTYAKLRAACLAIRAGARFIGTNPDTTFPSEAGIIPGAGSILALLRAASEVEPFVIGKPAPTMFLAAASLLGAPPERTLMIGDRLDTDIAGAQAAGMASAAVLTGVASRASLEESSIKPDFVFEDLVELLDNWRKAA